MSRSLRLLPLLLTSGLFTACVGQVSEEQGVDRFTDERGVPLPDFAPAGGGMRVMLGWQYRNVVTSLLGAAAGAVVTPPPDVSVNGFQSVGAAQLAMSSTSIGLYEASAMKAAEAAVAAVASSTSGRMALVGCVPKTSTDAACFETFVKTFGRKAWRRSLTADEVSTWKAVGVKAGAAYSDFQKGLVYVISGMLQSPHFIYQVEVGEDDGTGKFKLTGEELASRLSFFLTGNAPDEALLAAAESGDLDSAAGVRIQAERLIDSSADHTATRALFSEMLELEELESLSKDKATFPRYSATLGHSMREETERFIEEVLWTQEGDVRDLFDANYTFVDKALAGIYGVPAPASGFAKVELPAASGRAGLFSQASFLSLRAYPVDTSPTHRGKFIRERMLCQPVAAPPVGVDTTLDAAEPGTGPVTMRERLQQHQNNPSCAGCHVLMDNMGLALENFDALGQYRELDQGQPIDASGNLDDVGTFTGAVELGKVLREDPRIVQCLARTFFRFATGHVEVTGEKRPLKVIDDAFRESGYRVKPLLVEIAASDAFRYVGAGVQE